MTTLIESQSDEMPPGVLRDTAQTLANHPQEDATNRGVEQTAQVVDIPAVEVRTCEGCGADYDHEAIVFGGVDMIAAVKLCDSCTVKAEREEERIKRENEARARWEESVFAEYRKTDTQHPDYQAQIETHRACQQWVKGDGANGEERRLCLGLIGDSGKCKTRIVSQVVKRLIWEGSHVLWLNSSRFQWACQNQFNDANAQRASQALKSYLSASVLVFDDIGSLKSTETISDNLYMLLEHRTALGLPILWTSNETTAEMLNGKGITEKARKRNISRLAGYSNILEL